ncbi:MAG: ATP-binding cassette domain-containing protein [bacterium]|nr:ATP-binding cassette domain-containing protein [bacterium]
MYVKDYSKGMKQRLGLAVSLVNDPQLLIRDEPMNGLDPLGRIRIKRLIQKLKKQNKTIFFSSHILHDVEELADDFALIHKGKLLCHQKVSETHEDLESFFIQKIQEAKE